MGGGGVEDVDLAMATLRAVADRAVALLPQVRDHLVACAAPGEPAAAVARDGHRLATEFVRLEAWVRDGPQPVCAADQRAVLLQVLRFHVLMLHDATRLAFPKVRTARTEERRRALGALGEPAARLLAIRDALADD